MSLLAPGIPPRYLPQRAAFGAETPVTDPTSNGLAATLVIGGVVAFLGVLTLNSIFDEAPKVGGSDADILDRIRAEKAARDMSFSKAAYHSAKVNNLSRAFDQKARLSAWKAGK